MPKEMTFLEHLEELRIRVIKILLAIAVVMVLSFTLSIKEVRFSEQGIYLPLPDPFDSIASQAIRRTSEDVLPNFVQIIVTGPGQAIIAQLYVSVLLGVIVGMPVIAREIGAFVNPALYPHERKMVFSLLVPATGLFVAGAAFSYVVVVPFTLDFLYRYALVTGPPGQILTTITIDGLVGFILLFLIAFGVIFQLPIIMWVVTKAAIVPPSFWRKNFRYAFVAMIVFGAVITPDGSGITMFFIALPMAALYAVGIAAIEWRLKESTGEPVIKS